MATLDIGGQKVQVDDGFLALSPEAQNSTVEEITKNLPAQSRPMANFAAGGNETAADILGAPVDLMTGALNLGARGINALTGSNLGQISNPIGGSESIKSAFGLAGADPRNVQPGSDFDRLMRGAGQGAASVAVPYAGARAMIARGVEGLPGAIAGMLGGPAPAEGGLLRTGLGAAGNATIGAAGGAAGVGAETLVPDEYKPLANFAGNMVGGGLVAGEWASVAAY
jgi:hypothetical protein